MKESIVGRKSELFALRITKMFAYLQQEKHETVISKQILRSGTSIAANIQEAIGAQSDKDFLHKFSIAYKEARETRLWLTTLYESGYLTEQQFCSMEADLTELLKMIGSIQITMKKRLGIL